MLYITTRSKRDAFTAYRTLKTDRAPDGGLFLPMQFPRLSEKEVQSMIDVSFEETIANVMNLFFSAGLTQWDVGFCIGRNTMRLSEIHTKVYFSELWHNPGSAYDYVVNGLYYRVLGNKSDVRPSEWFRIVAKIAIVFGIYGALCREKKISFGDAFDLSVPADDLSYPIAILYAAEMGLPVGHLLCNCVENQGIWSIIHRGELSLIDDCDGWTAGLERLLLLRTGGECMERLLSNQRLFQLSPEETDRLKSNLSCVVSGGNRSRQAITSVFKHSGEILTPESALCVAGLGDYRAITGEKRYTLVIEENSPVMYTKEIRMATGLSEKQIEEALKE